MVSERPAVEEEREFGDEGDGYGDDGGEVEGVGRRGLADYQVAEREGDEDEGDGGHEEAEDDVAGRFDASLTGGELARVNFGDRLVAEQESEVGSRVEDGVGHGGEQRERAGGDGAVDLENGEDHVCGE